jgi:hypothetical protein
MSQKVARGCRRSKAEEGATRRRILVSLVAGVTVAIVVFVLTKADATTGGLLGFVVSFSAMAVLSGMEAEEGLGFRERPDAPPMA